MKTGSSRADRPLSFQVQDHVIPTGKEEEWRFTPLDRMADFFTEKATGKPPRVEVRGEATLEKVGRSDPRLGKVGVPEDRTGALAWESFQDAYIVTIAENSQPEAEIEIDVIGTGEADVAALHLLIVAEPAAQATVILNHTGDARVAEGVEIEVAENAHLTFVTNQEWADTARHTSSNRIRLDRNATLKHIVVSLGGDLIRVTTSVDFQAEGAEVDLLGAYYVTSGQHIEHRLFVDHSVPNCVSNAAYKGALQGDNAHSVWIGDVLIRPEAEGTDTYEMNRNLVLTAGPRADSVPNLEIETGEIAGAGHASATGRFDEEQLFYLRSRGINEVDARRLVVYGFFAELIGQIGVESVSRRLMSAIEAELETLAEFHD
ncbi:MAG: Fe-S cluster assembly protein SufD [Trueperella sp.]|nr:Fe-S cluster assembly protein SufD [Trueperella sp.]